MPYLFKKSKSRNEWKPKNSPNYFQSGWSKGSKGSSKVKQMVTWKPLAYIQIANYSKRWMIRIQCQCVRESKQRAYLNRVTVYLINSENRFSSVIEQKSKLHFSKRLIRYWAIRMSTDKFQKQQKLVIIQYEIICITSVSIALDTKIHKFQFQSIAMHFEAKLTCPLAIGA